MSRVSTYAFVVRPCVDAECAARHLEGLACPVARGNKCPPVGVNGGDLFHQLRYTRMTIAEHSPLDRGRRAFVPQVINAARPTNAIAFCSGAEGFDSSRLSDWLKRGSARAEAPASNRISPRPRNAMASATWSRPPGPVQWPNSIPARLPRVCVDIGQANSCILPKLKRHSGRARLNNVFASSVLPGSQKQIGLPVST